MMDLEHEEFWILLSNQVYKLIPKGEEKQGRILTSTKVKVTDLSPIIIRND